MRDRTYREVVSSRTGPSMFEPLEDRVLLSYTASIWTALNLDRSSLGSSEYKFQIHFVGSTAGDQLDMTSLRSPSVQLTGPGGTLDARVSNINLVSPIYRNPRLVPAPTQQPPYEYIVTYSVLAPGGTWDVADNGTYAIQMLANTVYDTTGTAVVWAGGSVQATATLTMSALPNNLDTLTIVDDLGASQDFIFYTATSVAPLIPDPSLNPNTVYVPVGATPFITLTNLMNRLNDTIDDYGLPTTTPTPFLNIFAKPGPAGVSQIVLTCKTAGAAGNAATIGGAVNGLTATQFNGGKDDDTDQVDIVMDAWQFGSSGIGIRNGAQASRTATFIDANGTRVTARMSGRGFAQINWIPGVPGLTADSFSLYVPFQQTWVTYGATSTQVPTVTANSSITITTKRSKLPTDNGQFELSGIASYMPVRGLTGKTTTVVGAPATLALVDLGGVDPGDGQWHAGPIRDITLASITNSVWDVERLSPALVYAGFYTKLSLAAGAVSNVSITSEYPFSTIQATSWLAGAGASSIDTPFINTLNITKGDLEADLTLTGADGWMSLNAMNVKKGFYRGTLLAEGSLGPIVVAGLDSANILAIGGSTAPLFTFNFATATVTDIAGTFTSQLGIVSLTVKPLNGLDAFINSNVAAYNIGTIVVANVRANNLGTTFGVVGHSVTSYSRKFLGTTLFSAANLVGTVPVVVDAVAPDYEFRLV